MNELESELCDLFQQRIDQAERPVNLLPGVRRRATRKLRQRVGAGALAGIALIAAVVVPAATGQFRASPALAGGYHRPPPGWVPLDYGNVRLWAPRSWTVENPGRCAARPSLGVLYDGVAAGRGCAQAADVLTIASRKILFTSGDLRPRPGRTPGATESMLVNSIVLRVRTAADGSVAAYAPELGADLTARGPVAIRVLETLTKSPIGGVMSGGTQAALPVGFRWHEFGGIEFAAPVKWRTQQSDTWGDCGPFVKPALDTVLLSTAKAFPGGDCPAFGSGAAVIFEGRQGIEVGSGPLARRPGGLLCEKMTGMRQFCYTAAPRHFTPVFALYLQPFGHHKPTVMYIGLAGHAVTAREIVSSVRPAPGQ